MGLTQGLFLIQTKSSEVWVFLLHLVTTPDMHDFWELALPQHNTCHYPQITLAETSHVASTYPQRKLGDREKHMDTG